MLFIFSIPVLIKYLWQLKTVALPCSFNGVEEHVVGHDESGRRRGPGIQVHLVDDRLPLAGHEGVEEGVGL